MKSTRHEWRLILLVLLLGILIIAIAGQAGLFLPPSWSVNAGMDSLINPEATYLAYDGPRSFPPVNAKIMTPLPTDYLTPPPPTQTRAPGVLATETRVVVVKQTNTRKPDKTQFPGKTPSQAPSKMSTGSPTVKPSQTSSPTLRPTATKITPVVIISPTKTKVKRTNTPIPSPTWTSSPTFTFTPTDTLEPTVTPRTPLPPKPTRTPSKTPWSTRTFTPTPLNSPTASDTLIPTETSTPSNTPIYSLTPSNTPWKTRKPSRTPKSNDVRGSMGFVTPVAFDKWGVETYLELKAGQSRVIAIPPLVLDGDRDYDLAYFATAPYPKLDAFRMEISQDGVIWYVVFAWSGRGWSYSGNGHNSVLAINADASAPPGVYSYARFVALGAAQLEIDSLAVLP